VSTPGRTPHTVTVTASSSLPRGGCSFGGQCIAQATPGPSWEPPLSPFYNVPITDLLCCRTSAFSFFKWYQAVWQPAFHELELPYNSPPTVAPPLSYPALMHPLLVFSLHCLDILCLLFVLVSDFSLFKVSFFLFTTHGFSDN
jgi:hypothetical protein